MVNSPGTSTLAIYTPNSFPESHIKHTAGLKIPEFIILALLDSDWELEISSSSYHH